MLRNTLIPIFYATYATIFGVWEPVNNENNRIPIGADISPTVGVSARDQITARTKQEVCKKTDSITVRNGCVLRSHGNNNNKLTIIIGCEEKYIYTFILD